MRRLFIKTIIISIILCNNLHAQWDYSHPIPGTASFNNHSNLFPNNDLDITNRNGIPVRESNLINWGEYNNLSSNGDDIVGFTWAQTRKGAMNVFVQLCDLDGNTLLIENGLQLTNDQWAQRESCIKYAGNNQWIVGWYDYRREAPCGNPLDTLNRLHNKPYFYLQKIDRYGNLLWGLNGVSLWNDSRENYVTDLVSDNNGGCIVVWEDRANYSYSGQHLGADGALLWMRDGFQLTENSSDISKILVYDNELYYSWTAIESRIKNIYVQKMNFEGQKLWGDNGVYLSEGYERNWYPQIIEDADGGIFVSWIREGLVFRGPLFVDIYLQHLDSNGSILFNEGGICLEQGGGPIGHYNFNFVNTRVNEFVYSFRREDLTDWTNKIYYQKCQVLDGEIVLGWNNSESDPKLAKELSSLMYNKELYLCNETSVILVIENEIYKIGFDGILSWNQPLFIENLSSSFSITLLDDNICAIESYHDFYNVATNYIQTYSLNTKNKIFEGNGLKLFDYESAKITHSKFNRNSNTAYFSWINTNIDNSMLYMQLYNLNNNSYYFSNSGIPALEIDSDNGEDYSIFYNCGVEIMSNGDIETAFTVKDNNNDESSLRCQRVDSNGDYLWQHDGITVSDFRDNFFCYIMFTELDNDESLWLFYEMSPQSGTDGNSSIRTQKVSPQGEKQFPEQYGKLVSEDGGYVDYEICDVHVTDTNGIAIAYSAEDEFRIVMIDSLGNLLWKDEAVLTEEFNYYASYLDGFKIVTAGDNLIVLWLARDETESINLYGQKLEIQNGNRIYVENVELISNLPSMVNVDILCQNLSIWSAWAYENEVFLRCHDFDFQPLNDESNSKLFWIGDFRWGEVALVENGEGGVYLIAKNGRRTADLDYNYFNIDKTYLYENTSWIEPPDTLIHMYSAQYNLEAAPDGKGGFFYMWEDTRIGTKAYRESDLYAGWIKNKAYNPSIPHKFSIYSPYPNPFNQYINIQYDVPEKSLVEISIYNLLGQRITFLKNMELEAGKYFDLWDGKTDTGKTLGSGTYFVRYRYGNIVESNKIILLK